MSKVRAEVIEEWSKGNADDGEWVDSDEPVTLHEPHQRIDYKSGIAGYKRGERGFWCDECGAKVTIGTDGSTEYGHFGDCPHRNVDRRPANNKGHDIR